MKWVESYGSGFIKGGITSSLWGPAWSAIGSSHNGSPCRWVVRRRHGSMCSASLLVTASVGVRKSNSVSLLRSSVPILCQLRGLSFGEAFSKWINLRRQSPDDPLGQRLDPARRLLLLPSKPSLIFLSHFFFLF